MSVLLGDLDRHDDSVIDIYCCGVGCSYGGEVPVRDLVARYGRAKALYDIRFKCTKCQGAKWMPIIQPEVLARKRNA